MHVDDNQGLPWMDWFTASIRQGFNWFAFVYTPQADRFRSFTTTALNSFTNPSNNNTDSRILNRLNMVRSLDVM